jgi:hypothetical protein
VVYPGQSQATLADQGALLRFRLPLPKLITIPLERGKPFPSREDRYRYIIPQHAAFTITLPGEQQQMCYVVLGSAEQVMAAESDFNAYGLEAVAYTYPGLWFNRDPYHLYKLMQNGQRSVFSAELPPLKKLPGLSVSTLRECEWQTELFSGLTAECFEGANASHDQFSNPPAPPLISLPTPSLEHQRVTVKLLHSSETKPVSSKHLLSHFRELKRPVVFSLVARPDAAYFQLSFAEQDRACIERQIQLYFPTLAAVPCDPVPAFSSRTLHINIARPEVMYLPVRSLAEFHHNPYSQILSAVAGSHSNSTALVEVFFQPIEQQAVTAISDQLKTYSGRLQSYIGHLGSEAKKYRKDNERYFSSDPVWSDNQRDFEQRWDEYLHWFDNYCNNRNEAHSTYERLLNRNPKLIDAAKKRVERIRERMSLVQKKLPAWFASVRITCDDQTLLEQLQRDFLKQFETTQQRWQASGLRPATALPRRIPKPGLFNTDELAGLISFPSNQLNSRQLEMTSSKVTDPPPLYTSSGIQLGVAEVRGQIQAVTLPDPVRDRHVYMIGRTRSGKSTLLFNMILQDILRGCGVGVIDPHGDLVQKILDYIPEHRIKDVVYINPTDEEHPIPLNILNATAQDNIGVLADDLIVTFRRLSDSWGERMDSVLRSVVYTLLRTPRPTFFDIQKILRDPHFRERIVSTLDYRPLQEFWEDDFPQMPKEASQPILHRMSKFALFPTLYAMLSEPTSAVSFDDVMQRKKILLVNLSQGELGEDNSKLIGCLLVSQIQLAAMRRAKLPKEQRKPFYLYIDEFQNFTSSAFEKILSEAGKFMLMLTVCHQYISQLDEQTRDALLGNVGTMIVLPVNEKDASQLRHSLGSYELPDILNLDAAHHEALCRPATKASDTFRFTTSAPPAQPSQSFANRIVEYSREQYSKKAAPLVEPQPVQVQQAAEEPPQAAVSGFPLPRPSPAPPKEIRTGQERVFHYVSVAEYLSTRQIIELCYSHLAENSRKAAASRDLKQLIADKKLKEQFFGKEKVYFVGRSCNPTSHNLAIRDLFIKIERSGFAISRIDFYPKLGALTPDLLVDFLLPDGSLLTVCWEYDTGTEGIAELQSKVKRYEAGATRARARMHAVVFVYATRARLTQVMRTLTYGQMCAHACLGEFESLSDVAFHTASGTIASLFS